jgi:hypothetical protein
MKNRSLMIGLMGLLPVLCPARGFKYFDASDTTQYPKLLSETGLFSDIAAKKLIPEAIKFEVNSPLWSDGAVKSRWVLLKPGHSVKFRELDDYWDYPDSAVFIKQFALDTIPGDSTSRIVWETRLLINKRESIDSSGTMADVWHGLSYKWNASQTDAELVPSLMGREDKLRVYPEGGNKPFIWKKWKFPSQLDCQLCHFQKYTSAYDFGIRSRIILGFFTAQLNRPSALTPGINQLEDFFRKGVLQGAKPQSWEAAPRWHAITDMSDPDSKAGSLDGRVRAYLGANCSGCHGRRGNEVGASMGMLVNFDFHTLEPQMELDTVHAHWDGVDTTEPLNVARGELVPGYPQKSYLLFRQLARNTKPDDFAYDPFAMPYLGTFEVDKVATDSIRKWIVDYKPAVSVRPRAERLHAQSPAFHGHRVYLPPDLLGTGKTKVTLHGLSGRTWILAPVGKGAYAIPPGLSQGVYILSVGSRRFTRYLF